MIDEPPVLTIKRTFERPSAADLKDLGATPTGFLVDAMGGRGALDHHIKPLGEKDGMPVGFCGAALPCFCGPADIMALVAAVEMSQPGDVLMVGTDAFKQTAVCGDLLLGVARNKGVVAFVTDGLMRDLEGIIGVGIPAFCAGLTPNSPVCKGPGTVGLPVALGGVTVWPGDVVVGDRDGVVVVPFAQIGAVRGTLPQVRAAEKELDRRVCEGLMALDITAGVMSPDSILWVD